jgi:hypothetical protein
MKAGRRRAFDDRPFTGHNSDVFRVALGAAIVAAALLTAVIQRPSVERFTGDLARSAATAPAQVAQDCTDGDGTWSSPPEKAASTLESTWKSPSLQAACSMAARGTIVRVATRGPSPSRAPAAQTHLQHIPLLI